jgi:hypothetical protein
MLADPTPTVVQQALLVLGNLCSNSVVGMLWMFV